MWNHLTEFEKKMSSGLFKNVINKKCVEILYLIYMNKKDIALNNLQWYTIKPSQTKSYIFDMYKKNLALDNLQWLICHKTKQNKTKSY